MGRPLDRRRAATNPRRTATKCLRPAEGTYEGVADVVTAVGWAPRAPASVGSHRSPPSRGISYGKIYLLSRSSIGK
jgi:hypothetical protein